MHIVALLVYIYYLGSNLRQCGFRGSATVGASFDPEQVQYRFHCKTFISFVLTTSFPLYRLLELVNL